MACAKAEPFPPHTHAFSLGAGASAGARAQITGGFEDVMAPEFLRFKWRLADWPEGAFSSVR